MEVNTLLIWASLGIMGFCNAEECPSGWTGLAGKCYRRIDPRKTGWEIAGSICRTHGSRLYVINDEAEYLAVNEAFGSSRYWIGCQDFHASGEFVCDSEPMSSVLAPPTGTGKTYVDRGALKDTGTFPVTADSGGNDVICEAYANEITDETLGNCPYRWRELGDNCYRYQGFMWSWVNSDEVCRKEGGSSLLFATQEGKDAIFSSKLFPKYDVWIGCQRLDGENDWNCSVPSDVFIDFDQLEPDSTPGDKCLAMNASGDIRIENCEVKLHGICQMPKSQYLGCYADNVDSRTLSGGYIQRDDNDLLICRGACSRLNYAIAGLGTATECFCGNMRYSRKELLEDWKCTRSCSGWGTCGGIDKIAVYETGMKADTVKRKYRTTRSKRLAYEVYSVQPTRSFAACANACTSSSECLSFNHCSTNTEGSYNCELNYDTKDMQPDSFSDNPDCAYGEVIMAST